MNQKWLYDLIIPILITISMSSRPLSRTLEGPVEEGLTKLLEQSEVVKDTSR